MRQFLSPSQGEGSDGGKIFSLNHLTRLKEQKMKKILLLICCLFLSWNANAMEVAGVKLPDSIHLGNHDLVLNGAGLRTRFFFKVYVAALYLGEKTHAAEAALNQSGVKRVSMHILREISDEKMLNAFNEAMVGESLPCRDAGPGAAA